MKNIQRAVNTLEEVFKVEQSGIDNIERVSIIKGMKDDEIRYDGYDEYKDMAVDTNPAAPHDSNHIPESDTDGNHGMMTNDILNNTNTIIRQSLPLFNLGDLPSLSDPVLTSPEAINASPEGDSAKQSNVPVDIIGPIHTASHPMQVHEVQQEMNTVKIATPLEEDGTISAVEEKMQQIKNDLDEASLSPRPPIQMSLSLSPPPKTNHSNVPVPVPVRYTMAAEPSSMSVESDSASAAGDTDPDYVPSDTEMQQHTVEERNELMPIHAKSSERRPESDADLIVSTETEAADLEADVAALDEMTKSKEKSIEIVSPIKSTKFDQFPKSSIERLQTLKIGDPVAVYMFGEWQPADVIATALMEVVVHFTHFDDRGSVMDQLLPLDPEILSINHVEYAISTAQSRTRHERAVISAVNNTDRTDQDTAVVTTTKAVEPEVELISDHRYKVNSKIDIEESNEKYYQWKKCEIATAHHLKYLYERLLEDPRKFHLSSRDRDILQQKVAIMVASYEHCRKEIQEQVN